VSEAIKIRLWGLRSECQTAARRIASVLPVVSVSEPRAHRDQSSLVRVYIAARLADTGPHHTAADRELEPGS
jgi:hypothetical protein